MRSFYISWTRSNSLNFPVECAGYIARIFSHFDTTALGPYIVQTMLILVAPPLFAASIYMTLGRIVVKLGAEDKSIIPVRLLTKIFVVGDVVSFLLQCGGMTSGYPPTSSYSIVVGADSISFCNRGRLHGCWYIISNEHRRKYRHRRLSRSASLLWILRYRVCCLPLALQEAAADYPRSTQHAITRSEKPNDVGIHHVRPLCCMRAYLVPVGLSCCRVC